MKVPWQTTGFKFRFHAVTDDMTEDEGTATSLLKIPETKKVNSYCTGTASTV